MGNDSVEMQHVLFLFPVTTLSLSFGQIFDQALQELFDIRSSKQCMLKIPQHECTFFWKANHTI